MQARTLLYKGMVLSPAVFIAWLAIQGRFLQDTHEFVACTQRQHQIISSYRHPVQVVGLFGNTSIAKLSDESLIFTTSLWRREYRIGSLQPINPAEYGRSIRDGVASQIASANRKVVRMQLELSKRALESGNKSLAVERLIDAYELAGITKYSDPVSITLFSGDQRHILESIDLLAQQLPERDKQTVVAFASKELANVQGMEPIARQVEALQKSYHRGRERPTDIENGSVRVARAEASTYAEDSATTQVDAQLANRGEQTLRLMLNSLVKTSQRKSTESSGTHPEAQILDSNLAANQRPTSRIQKKNSTEPPGRRRDLEERRESGIARR